MNKAVLFIFITLLIDITGIGLILPVLPDLIRSVSNTGLSDATRIGGFLLIAYAIPQFLCAPILGALSDRFGRRPILLLSLFGFGVDNLIMGFAPVLSWLFIGRIFAGVFGASISTGLAFIADISTPEKRAANFGMVGAAFGLGFILGPLIGGFLGEVGTRLPFFVAAGLSFANVIFGFFVLPESLKPENRRPFEWRRANPFGALIKVSRNRIVLGLIVAFLLSEIAHHAYQSTWTFYTIERFQFSSGTIGLSLGVFGLLYALVNGWLIRVVMPRVGPVNAVWLGLGFTMTAFFGLGLLNTEWLFWIMLLPAALGGFLTPAMQGIMANETPDNAQGELQGAIASLKGIGAILGPVMMTQLFAHFTADGSAMPLYLPGAPFLAGLALLVIALIPIVDALRRYRRLNDRGKEPVPDSGLSKRPH